MSKTPKTVKKAKLVFFMCNSMMAYRLWNILLMKPGEKKDEALHTFMKIHPPRVWGVRIYRIINRYLSCKSTVLFEGKVDELARTLEVVKLDDLNNIIRGCKAFEHKMMRFRKSHNGNFVFGETDRIRILCDKLEEIYGGFRPLVAVAA